MRQSKINSIKTDSCYYERTVVREADLSWDDFFHLIVKLIYWDNNGREFWLSLNRLGSDFWLSLFLCGCCWNSIDWNACGDNHIFLGLWLNMMVIHESGCMIIFVEGLVTVTLGLTKLRFVVFVFVLLMLLAVAHSDYDNCNECYQDEEYN